MERLISDTEGALAGDEAGVMLQRKGVERKLVPKEKHLGLIERHGELLKSGMRKLRLAAEQERSKRLAPPEVQRYLIQALEELPRMVQCLE